MKLLSFLDRSHSVAKPGYNRWLVPPAALAIHLCIGQIYAYSVFNKPMTQIIGITESTAQDWELTTLGWIFSIALFTLGASAAIFGKWLERVGPRKAMFASALCFSGGFFVASLGVHLHQIWLIYLGHGVIGGIGLGLGYISPVSTLIKWFPDRPGMATGMAIMGFGGGAMIASPLSVSLMNHFKSAASVGVAETFLVMGALYFTFMMFGVFTVRVPAEGWKPAGVDSQTLYREKPNDHYRSCGRRHGHPYAAVLFVIRHLDAQRNCGHRCIRTGVGDDPGDVLSSYRRRAHGRFGGGSRRLCRPLEFVQHAGALSSGHLYPTELAARTPITSFSCWEHCSIFLFLLLERPEASSSSCSVSV
jgi:hypothetical protein